MIALYRSDSSGIFSPARWMLAAMVALLLGSTQTWAQFGPGGPGGMAPGRGGTAGRGADPQTADAEKQVEGMAELLLKDYVILCKPLARGDIAEIQRILDETKNYHARFSNENRARVHMIEAFLAHYVNKPDQAIAKAQQAYDIAPNDQDVSDSVITLALLHGQYELARNVLSKRGAGKDVAIDFAADAGGAALAGLRRPGASRPDTSDPNTAGRSTGAPRRDSPWSRAGGTPGRSGRTPGRTGGTPGRGGLAGPGGAMPPGMPGMPGGMPGRPGIGGPGRGANRRGILNLPVENMLFEDLGKPFNPVFFHCLNGSLYPFNPGQGQLLLALLWDVPDNAQGQTGGWGGPRGAGRGGAGVLGMGITPGPGGPMGGRGSGARSGRGLRAQNSQDEEQIPEVATDLWTNADEFLDLFRQHAMERKVSFLGVNFTTPASPGYEQILDILTERPWPWPTCLAGDAMNQPQWLWQGASVAMMMVDTKGAICYAGPVGGFLPKMLFDAELAQAQPDTMAQKLAGMGDPAALGGSFAWPGTPPGGDQNGMTALQTADQPTDQQPGQTRNPLAKQSDVQAARMLQTAGVQKVINPISALNMCDEILERYGDSLEADEAKLLIKSILNRRPDLEKMRQRQGKYLGNEPVSQTAPANTVSRTPARNVSAPRPAPAANYPQPSRINDPNRNADPNNMYSAAGQQPGPSQTAAGAQNIDWQNDYRTVQRDAQRSAKPILIVFHAKWCGPCKQMKKTTYKDPAVIAVVQNFIPVYVDIDEQQDMKRRFEVNAIPRYIVLASNGDKVLDFAGYNDPASFANRLKQVLQ